jgi:hypothetical protein
MSHISLPSVRIAPLGTGGAPADEVISSTRAGSFSSVSALTTVEGGEVAAFVGRNAATAGASTSAIRLNVFNNTSGLIISQASTAPGPAWSIGGYDAFIRTSQGDAWLNFAAGSETPQMHLTPQGRLLVGTTAAGNTTAGGIRATGASQFDAGLTLGSDTLRLEQVPGQAYQAMLRSDFNTGLRINVWDTFVAIDAVQADNIATQKLLYFQPNGAATRFGGPVEVGASQVVTSRRTGWGAPTGTATRTAFATGSVTTAQLAERVKALIDDLTTHGLIGA